MGYLKRWEWLWPDVDIVEGDKKAAMQGFWACVFIMVFCLWGSLDDYFKNPSKLDSDNLYPLFIVVLVMSFVAWRISKMSRVWSVIGLLLYVAVQAYTAILNPSDFKIGYFTFILPFMFINSVRGTSAYHKRVKSNQESGAMMEI